MVTFLNIATVRLILTRTIPRCWRALFSPRSSAAQSLALSQSPPLLMVRIFTWSTLPGQTSCSSTSEFRMQSLNLVNPGQVLPGQATNTSTWSAWPGLVQETQPPRASPTSQDVVVFELAEVSAEHNMWGCCIRPVGSFTAAFQATPRPDTAPGREPTAPVTPSHAHGLPPGAGRQPPARGPPSGPLPLV